MEIYITKMFTKQYFLLYTELTNTVYYVWNLSIKNANVVRTSLSVPYKHINSTAQTMNSPYCQDDVVCGEITKTAINAQK